MKKRNKKYRPSSDDNMKLKTQLYKVHAIFRPLEAILDQLEDQGTIDVAKNGTPIFRDHNDGYWYDTVIALNGVIEGFEIHEIRNNIDLHLEPLRQISKKLKYSMPIFDSETKMARECLFRMRKSTLEMTAGYARELIKDFQIKEELEALA